ncbi:hypothetical protein HNQ76_000843 [Thermosulfuriphilus ammonigenes]|nr:hypothetical protein [Thermosulfuriphilus ammonigenes]
MRGTDSIMWTIKFRNGVVLRFKFPIRTTPEGEADPTVGKPDPSLDAIGDNRLFTEIADGVTPATPENPVAIKFAG